MLISTRSVCYLRLMEIFWALFFLSFVAWGVYGWIGLLGTGLTLVEGRCTRCYRYRHDCDCA